MNGVEAYDIGRSCIHRRNSYREPQREIRIRCHKVMDLSSAISIL